MRHLDGAGDGNRTHAASLEGWNSTIELHPHYTFLFERSNMIPQTFLFVNTIFEIFLIFVKTIALLRLGVLQYSDNK